ncbi:hypothetical protein [Nonomuraea sp. NPDC023979]|uniref:hypothetical protein n=1 Tax=Nonomuraea sp. NPDC023979 TaxID=3154796 RepID=UPI0033E99989
MSESNEGAEPGGALEDPVWVLRMVGWIAIGGGVLLALIQANSSGRNSGLWILIFLGVAILGALLRIEAAIRDAKRH